MAEEWTDTRWHLKITPLAEHLIPVVSRKVKGVMLGDIDLVEAIASVHDLTMTCQRSIRKRKHPATSSPLQGQCSSVCSDIVEHVQVLKRDWVDHLNAVHSEIRKIEQSIRSDMEETQAVHQKYRNRNTSIVDVEFRTEVKRTKNNLEERLAGVKAKKEPSVIRSVQLTSQCDSLKRSFSESYQQIATENIIRCRQHFEDELNTASLAIAIDFAKEITLLLEHS